MSFIGFDMMKEPEPRWPAWLDRWYREANPPRGTTMALFSKVMKEVYSRERIDWQIGNTFVIPLKTEYTTPPAIEARVRAREAARKAR